MGRRKGVGSEGSVGRKEMEGVELGVGKEDGIVIRGEVERGRRAKDGRESMDEGRVKDGNGSREGARDSDGRGNGEGKRGRDGSGVGREERVGIKGKRGEGKGYV